MYLGKLVELDIEPKQKNVKPNKIKNKTAEFIVGIGHQHLLTPHLMRQQTMALTWSKFGQQHSVNRNGQDNIFHLTRRRVFKSKTSSFIGQKNMRKNRKSLETALLDNFTMEQEMRNNCARPNKTFVHLLWNHGIVKAII